MAYYQQGQPVQRVVSGAGYGVPGQGQPRVVVMPRQVGAQVVPGTSYVAAAPAGTQGAPLPSHRVVQVVHQAQAPREPAQEDAAGLVRALQAAPAMSEPTTLTQAAGPQPKTPYPWLAAEKPVEAVTLAEPALIAPAPVEPAPVQAAAPAKVLETMECFKISGAACNENVQVKMSWKYSGTQVPIHTACLKLGNKEQSLGAVFYGNVEDAANKVEHQRSWKECGGMAESESFLVQLKGVSSEVQALCFVINTPSTFKDVKDLQVTLVDGKKQEICTFAPKGDYSKNNAIVGAMIWRVGGTWLFEAIGNGYGIKDPGACEDAVTYCARLLRQSATNEGKKTMAKASPMGPLSASVDASGVMQLTEDMVKASLDFNCSWNFGGKELPVHSCCLKLGPRAELVGATYFGDLEDGANKIEHKRDYKPSGAMADNETISFTPSAVGAGVQYLCFVISTIGALQQLEGITASLKNKDDGGQELCALQMEAAAGQNTLIIGVLYRKGASWAFKFSGDSHKIEDVGPCKSLLPQLQKICKGL